MARGSGAIRRGSRGPWRWWVVVQELEADLHPLLRILGRLELDLDLALHGDELDLAGGALFLELSDQRDAQRLVGLLVVGLEEQDLLEEVAA
jgi:hypothetical protein